jgi:hypothetical protein
VVAPGATKAEVLRKCGEPTMREFVGEKTTWGTTRRRGSYYGASTTVPVEEWTYDQGSCRFSRILTFYGSKLVTIELGDKS